ncbi:MAG: MgtC/SapB family protein [Bradymonadaceae bacterium]
MEFDPSLEWPLIRSIGISLALGAVVGLERQSHKEPERRGGSIGVRTFALSALLGTLAVISQDISPALPIVTGAGFFILILAFFWFEHDASQGEVGITTQISALVVFLLGAMVPSNPLFAAGIAVIVASVLSIKRYTHYLVGLLKPDEVLATMKFLLVTVVLLPLLPNETVDPWGIYNPRELWLLVVLISGISFMAYFAIRFLGRSRGLVWTGILGGMASSTAVTLSMSRQVRLRRSSQEVLLSAAFAILIASAFMFLRVSIAVGIVNPSLLATLWIPFTIMAIPGSLVVGAMWYRVRLHMRQDQIAETDGDELELENPFELVPAFKFALLLILIIGAANALQAYFGDRALYLAAVFGGIAETNAISLAVARMANVSDLSDVVATRAIVIAILANSFVKAGLSAIVGSSKLGRYVALGLLPILVAGVIGLFVIG